MKAPVMHLIVALVWLFLSGEATLGNFLFGIAAGFILLVVFQRVLQCESYIRRTCNCVIFVCRLLLDIFRSNIRITRLILSKQAASLGGRFAYYDVNDLTQTEIILISMSLSLTPGTTVAEHTAEGQLVLHTFPALSDEEVKSMVDRTVKQAILAFTR